MAFQVPYRIRAVVVAVQEDSSIGWFAWSMRYGQGGRTHFSQLASMLQAELDAIFDQPSGASTEPSV